MSSGSALLYTGSVFHGAGPNESDADRVGMNLTYSLAWLRQEENQYLSCPPEIAKDLEPAMQDLLGYTLGSYALGYYTPPLPPGEGASTPSAPLRLSPRPRRRALRGLLLGAARVPGTAALCSHLDRGRPGPSHRPCAGRLRPLHRDPRLRDLRCMLPAGL